MLSVLRSFSSRSIQIPLCQQARKASSDITVIPEDEDAIKDEVVIKKSIADSKPVFHSRDDFWQKYPQHKPGFAREAWVEDLNSTQDDNSAELLKLHPDVWGVLPRLDIIFANLEWQKHYKRVDWEYVKDRYEVEIDDTSRPWPQKGGGRARHATRTSPIWTTGGKCHGNKGPHSFFFMLPYHMRVNGLIHTLSAKFAQDDVKIVKNLDIPSDDPKYIEDLIDERQWPLSTLFVDKSDKFPSNITAATMNIMHVNLMPAYGLNVHSMLIHKNLVLTKAAVEHIEDRLLFAQRRLDLIYKNKSAQTEARAELAKHNPTGSLS